MRFSRSGLHRVVAVLTLGFGVLFVPRQSFAQG